LARRHTLTTRHNLAETYRKAGRTGEAIAILEPLLLDLERVQGATHPHTLTTRNGLGLAYMSVGRTEEAIAIQKALLIAFEQVLGREHPHTLGTRHNLALACRESERVEQAITSFEALHPDCLRVLGARMHPPRRHPRPAGTDAIEYAPAMGALYAVLAKSEVAGTDAVGFTAFVFGVLAVVLTYVRVTRERTRRILLAVFVVLFSGARPPTPRAAPLSLLWQAGCSFARYMLAVCECKRRQSAP
jgi:Tetratricopeptide repeat